MNSVSVENFLKNVFTLKYDEGEKASTSNLSVRLGISGPAITDMAKKLAAKGLIVYQPYKELVLTEEGKTIAIKVIRRHRIWEMFLHQVLHMDLDEVHQEAELLEHQTSDNLLEKIDQHLEYPEFDPHGDPIPKPDGSIKKNKNVVKLDEMKSGEQGLIVRLIYSDLEVQQLFKHYDIKTNKTFKIMKIFDLDQSMDVDLNGQRVHLSLPIQKRIYCKYI